MFEEFYSHLFSLNYFWIAGAVLFGFFAGRIFKRGTLFFAAMGYVGFVFPTMKFGNVVQGLGLSSSFSQVANGWGLTPYDLSSVMVVGITVLVTGVFWALSQ